MSGGLSFLDRRGEHGGRDGQRLLYRCYARVYADREAELQINNPCYKAFGHAEDIDYVAWSTYKSYPKTTATRNPILDSAKIRENTGGSGRS